MSRNAYQKGDRIEVLFSVAHAAGEFAYEKGYYGVVEEAVAAGRRGYLILGRVWTLPKMAANLAMGTKVYAQPTATPTSLPLGAATTGWNAVGRTFATANASGIGPVQLFNPNNY